MAWGGENYIGVVVRPLFHALEFSMYRTASFYMFSPGVQFSGIGSSLVLEGESGLNLFPPFSLYFTVLRRVFFVLGTVTGGTGSVLALSFPGYQGHLCTVSCFVYPGATSNSVRHLPLYLVPSYRIDHSHTFSLCQFDQ